MNKRPIQVVSLLVCALGLLFPGCSDRESSIVPNLVTRGGASVEVAHTYVTNVLDLACQQDSGTYDRLGEIMKWVGTLPVSNRVEVFREFCRVMREPKLPDSSDLNKRNTAYGIYFTVVHAACLRFSELLEDEEAVWRFMLDTFDFFPKEIARSKNPSFGVLERTMGMRWDKKIYVGALYENRFHMIRNMFEFDSRFTKYFNALPVDRRKIWQKNLEQAAARPIIVHDPKISNQPRVLIEAVPELAEEYAKRRDRYQRYLERRKHSEMRGAKFNGQSRGAANQNAVIKGTNVNVSIMTP